MGGTLTVDTITPKTANETTVDGDFAVSGTLLVDTMTSSVSDHVQVNDNFSVRDNVSIGGNLSLTGYLSAKPYVSLRVSTSTATPAAPSTGTIAGTIGTPGTVSLAQYGFLTNVSVARGTAGANNSFLYTFTLPTAHPLGTNYIVHGGFQTGGTSAPSPNAFLTFSVSSSTSFTVWVRGPTNILLDGTFYVYTVP